MEKAPNVIGTRKAPAHEALLTFGVPFSERHLSSRAARHDRKRDTARSIDTERPFLPQYFPSERFFELPRFERGVGVYKSDQTDLS